MSSNVASGPHDSTNQRAVYVFEAPVRLWHWVHTFSFLTLAVTGYLIANPLPALAGEASDHFLMGNIRLIHFIAAYVFAIGFAVRAYWALVGNRFAREIFYLPFWRGAWWKDLFFELRFYSFLTRHQHKTLGHNRAGADGHVPVQHPRHGVHDRSPVSPCTAKGWARAAGQTGCSAGSSRCWVAARPRTTGTTWLCG